LTRIKTSFAAKHQRVKKGAKYELQGHGGLRFDIQPTRRFLTAGD